MSYFKFSANSWIVNLTMDLLRAEIERKRKLQSALIDQLNPDCKIGKSRFIRQSDVIDHNLKSHVEEQNEADRKRLKIIETDIAVDELIQFPLPSGKRIDVEAVILSVGEVKMRLRKIGQPITLFAENDENRLNRLRSIESMEGGEDDFKLSGAGHSNIVNPDTTEETQRLREDQEDDDDDDDDCHGEKNKSEEAYQTDHSFKITQFSKDLKLPRRKVILKYFRALLKNWEWDLKARPDAEKMTAKGKMDTKTQKQCKDYIRHLFKLCKKGEVPFDIEEKLFLVS